MNIKELVEELAKQGHPEAIAFRDYVKSILKQCRTVQGKATPEMIQMNSRGNENE